jgi:hypothetical protein
MIMKWRCVQEPLQEVLSSLDTVFGYVNTLSCMMEGVDGPESNVKEESTTLLVSGSFPG